MSTWVQGLTSSTTATTCAAATTACTAGPCAADTHTYAADTCGNSTRASTIFTTATCTAFIGDVVQVVEKTGKNN